MFEKFLEKFSKSTLMFLFVVFVLVMNIIYLAAWKLATYNDAVNTISIASSLASILLAIIAIGYAFFQSNESSRQNDKLDATLRHINEKIVELLSIKSKIDEMQSQVQNSTNLIVGFRDKAAGIIDAVDEMERIKTPNPEKLGEVRSGLSKIVGTIDALSIVEAKRQFKNNPRNISNPNGDVFQIIVKADTADYLFERLEGIARNDPKMKNKLTYVKDPNDKVEIGSIVLFRNYLIIHGEESVSVEDVIKILSANGLHVVDVKKV